MVFVVAILIFAALSAATWYVSVACFKSTYGDSLGATAVSDRATVALCAIGAVTLTCFIPFPAGYVAGLFAWAVAVYGFLDLPTGRASVLVGYLAAASVVSRLVVLGVLSSL
jgi:hypothetical protein